MFKRIPFSLASGFMLVLIVLILIFHLLVVCNYLPSNLVWGGRLQDNKELWLFESVSTGINLFLFWIIIQRAGWIRPVMKEKVLKVLLRVMAFLLLLNTLGNSMAVEAFERYFFGSLTLLSALFCWRMSLDK